MTFSTMGTKLLSQMKQARSCGLMAVALVLLSAIFSIGGCTSATETTVEKIDAQAAFELIQQNQGNPDFVVLDVRTPQEYVEERLADAVNLDFYEENFRSDLDKLDKARTYVVYCRTGNRSAQAAAIMEELGFQRVYDAGGIVEWIEKGLPTVK